MLFFYELVEQEKSKFSTNSTDRQLMSDLALLARIEQFLRYGSLKTEMARNPKVLLQSVYNSNTHFLILWNSVHYEVFWVI